MRHRGRDARTSRRQEEGIPTQGQPRRRFVLEPASCAVLVQARSNVGTVEFGTTDLRGDLTLARAGDVVDLDSAPAARLEVPLASLTSGNALYDAEVRQRLAVRRFPLAVVELLQAEQVDGVDYRVTGNITLHGVTTQLRGDVSLRFPEQGVVAVTGEHVVDIRAFDIGVPTVMMLRIYPEVRVSLELLARETDHEGAST